MEQKRFTLPEHRGLPASVLFIFFCVVLRIFYLFVCLFVFVCFFVGGGVALFVVFLYLVCSMLLVALGCSFVNAFSVFSKKNCLLEFIQGGAVVGTYLPINTTERTIYVV